MGMKAPKEPGVYTMITVVTEDGNAKHHMAPVRQLVRATLNEPNPHRFLAGMVGDGLRYLEGASK